MAVFFEGERGGTPFVSSSGWEPNRGWEPKRSRVTGLVWDIVEEDQKVMKGVREIQEIWNLSEDEWVALQRIRRDNSVVIKPADKRSMVVIMVLGRL